MQLLKLELVVATATMFVLVVNIVCAALRRAVMMMATLLVSPQAREDLSPGGGNRV